MELDYPRFPKYLKRSIQRYVDRGEALFIGHVSLLAIAGKGHRDFTVRVDVDELSLFVGTAHVVTVHPGRGNTEFSTLVDLR